MLFHLTLYVYPKFTVLPTILIQGMLLYLNLYLYQKCANLAEYFVPKYANVPDTLCLSKVYYFTRLFLFKACYCNLFSIFTKNAPIHRNIFLLKICYYTWHFIFIQSIPFCMAVFIQSMLCSLTSFLSKVFDITGLYILSNYVIFH
jgi:hypothetical protein